MPSICIIGGGPAGICAGVKIKAELCNTDFTIFETHHDFGGTWISHTYPNCEVDVPSHIYSYSFAQKSDWESVYAKQPEMARYLQEVALEHDLYPHAKFNHCVKKMEWVKERNYWKVTALNKTTEKLTEHNFDFVIFAVGYFLLPKIPTIFKSFKGTMIHSAKWDHSLNLNDKVVAVIGSGFSTVQVIPGIVKDVKKLYSFQRRPAYVLPKPQYDISSTTRAILKKVPFLALLFLLFESISFVITKNSRRNRLATSFTQWLSRGQTLSTTKQSQLRPDYAFATTQPTFSNDYFPAMAYEHVEVILDEVVKVEGNSIFTADGQGRRVDIIILTTGYHQTYQQRGNSFSIQIIKRDKDISKQIWGKADNYLSLMKEQLPNAFMLGGPNAGLVHLSHFYALEFGMSWILKVLKEMKNRFGKQVELKKGVQKEFMLKLEKEKRKWVMIEDDQEPETAGDKDDVLFEMKKENSANSILCPWGAIGFWKKLRTVQFEHLQFP